MCGIAGILGVNANEERLTAMLNAQNHRGPDATGIYVKEGIVLGHNRLSIIDLSPEANQPFFSEDQRFILVFNGEIYNYLELKSILKSQYSFKTSSDTEVLLAAYKIWGKDCLAKLNGMFAFAIWDSHTQELFAARDRFGIKPFYYCQHQGSFHFSSEIKAMHRAGVPKQPNDKVWASYFKFGTYGTEIETFWNDIHQLPGGHYLTYKLGTLHICKWYYFEEEIKKYQKQLSLKNVIATYKKLLQESIQRHFRADVPVGFNISGGLDSSTLLTFVNKLLPTKHIQAFTFYCNHTAYDELPWVNSMIALTNNPLHKVLLEVEELAFLLKKEAINQYEPFGGIPTIAYGKLFKEAQKKGIKVLLDGQGMDEQWAGYDYYLKNNHQLIQGIKVSPYKPQALNQEFSTIAQQCVFPTPFQENLLNLQYRDLFYTKIPRALRFNDRVSMAASTELRVPFLDHNLVEFAVTQPIEYKIKNDVQKYVLRELVGTYLSPTITLAPKRPLQTPQREWLGNELKSFVTNELIKLIDSSYNQWFNKDVLYQSWKDYLDGDNDSSFHIWQWLNTSLLLCNDTNY